MVLSSAIFLFVFFPAAFAVYHVVPGIKGKNVVLLAFGLVFYAFGGLWSVPLLALSVLVNWLCGRALARAEAKRARRALVTAAVGFNVALIAVFKYADFAVANLNALLGTAIPLPGIPLPLGVSFFTFTAMSYVIEVYRKPANAAKGFLETALYISFFPAIVSGPIVPWRQAAPQLRERTHAPEATARGIRRFIVGLSKQLLIADVVGRMVDGLFAAGAADARIAWLGAAGYAVQILFDFSGYTDMALGVGQVFGFTLPENFDRPYTALGLTDFWKRWHMSLTGWFRNYLYMPIVMSRPQQRLYKKWAARYGRPKANKLAILIPMAAVWMLTGLWHGAAWSFVLWGLWQGLFCALEGVGIIRTDGLKKTAGGRLVLRLYTAAVILVGDVLFRAGSLSRAGTMLAAMFTGWRFSPACTLQLQLACTPMAVCALVLGGVLSLLPGSVQERLAETRWAQPADYALSLALLALCVASMAQSGFVPFIYQQF